MEWKLTCLCCLLLCLEKRRLEVDGGVVQPLRVLAGRRVSPRADYFAFHPGGGSPPVKVTKSPREEMMMNGMATMAAQQEQCNGEENFKNHIGIMSFILSIFSSTAGILGLVKLTGTTATIVGIIDEGLGLVSLSLDSVTTFPNKFEKAKRKAKAVLGDQFVDSFLNNYGCGNGNGDANTVTVSR